MGTRGLLGVILAKGRKKGTYSQFDSYPSGLGVAIVKFIKSLSEDDIQQMIKNLENVVRVKEGSKPSLELQSWYTNAGFARLDVSTRRPDDWYCLLRNVQDGAALPNILHGSLEHLIDSTDFAGNGLHCEWVYWVDFTKRELKIENGADAKATFEELSVEWMEKVGAGPGAEEEGPPGEDEEDTDDDDDGDDTLRPNQLH